jgi:hypothetical protein
MSWRPGGFTVRKLAPFAVAAASSMLLAACGSSSSGAAAPPPSGPLSGTIGGRAFAPAEIRAISVGSGSTPCAIPQVGSFGVRAVALTATSYAGACGDLGAAQCQLHKGSQQVTILVAKANPLPPNSEPALTPGTYQVASNIRAAVPEANGTLDLAYAEAVAPDPSCAGTAHPSTGGTIRIDQVSGPITGHVSITFDDGSSISGDFSAPLCGAAPNVCSVALGGALCAPPPACL